MRTDRAIERDVANELRWSPDVDDRDIAVKVTGGVVTLTGLAQSYRDKSHAETAAKRVSGVVGIANDIEVRLAAMDARPDPDIARGAVAALKSELAQSADRIRVLVHQGRLTLEGDLEWYFQRDTAESAVRPLKGVVSVSNLISIKPLVAPADVKRCIEEAFRRSAAVDASHITVDAHGSEITLQGTVRSWTEREEAQRTAWSAPGVTSVRNEISVGSWPARPCAPRQP
jgi:osmotically-inducible protein OsmY